MKMREEYQFLGQVLAASAQELIPNLVKTMQEPPHMGEPPEDLVIPSEEWDAQVKEKERLDLKEGPLNEAGGLTSLRLDWTEEDEEEWQEWLKQVKR